MHTSQHISIIAIALSVAISPATAQPADTYHGCKVVSAKVSAHYDLNTRMGQEFPSAPNSLKTAELIADVAYGKSRKELRKVWPGLYEWTVLTTTTAFDRRLTSSDFESFSLLECVRRFG